MEHATGLGPLRVGFTGTRKGMAPKQRETVRVLLAHMAERGVREVHHGDCLGADAEFDGLALAAGLRRVVHPPTNPKLRAFCAAEEVRQERPYRERDEDIVAEVDVVVATPKEYRSVPRGSGTWLTIRCARRAGRALLIVWPNGGVSAEEAR